LISNLADEFADLVPLYLVLLRTDKGTAGHVDRN